MNRYGSDNPTPTQIRKLRLSANLTQAQAAELTRVTILSWQNWERGRRRMHAAFYELFKMKLARLGESKHV